MMQIAIDPGITNGWATYANGIYISDEVYYDGVWDFLISANKYNDVEVIVYEDFLYVQGLGKTDLTAVQVIGVIEEWARQNHVPTHRQYSFQKAYFTDKKLRLANLFKATSGGHSNDAMRHLLYFQGAWEKGDINALSP